VLRERFVTADVVAAVVLALTAAMLYALSNVLELNEAEQVDEAHALRFSLLLLLARRRMWVVGFISDGGGFVVSAAALAYGSVAFVTPILALGLLFSLLLGSLIHRRPVTRGDWLAAFVLCASLAMFLSMVSPEDGRDTMPADRAGVAVPAVVAAITLCLLCARVFRGPPRSALLAIAAGIAFAMSAVLTKAFVHYLGDGILAWWDHWEPYGMACFVIGGFLLIQSSFQLGNLGPSVAGVEATEPVVAVILGVSLLDESIAVETLPQVVVVVVSLTAVVCAIVALAQTRGSLAGIQRQASAPGPRTEVLAIEPD
jgi:drug/metabolite transporter (DMT)-like permease